MDRFKRVINKSKHKTIDIYIKEKWHDVFVYAFMLGLFDSLLLNLIPNIIFQIIIIIVSITIVIEKIYVYKTFKKIKKYLVNSGLINDIGNILFCNDRNYFLTDNYIILEVNGVINCFSYSDIRRIYKKRKISGSLMHNGENSYFEYLHIVTNSNDYEVTIYSTALINEDFYDISNFLLEKNPNIIDEGFIKKKAN